MKELEAKYATFSGVDTRFSIEHEIVGTIQGVSFKRIKVNGEWQIQGTIENVLLNQGSGALPEKFDQLLALSVNENGIGSVLYVLQDIEITGHSFGQTLDDIVGIETYTFMAKIYMPGYPLGNWKEQIIVGRPDGQKYFIDELTTLFEKYDARFQHET